MQANAGGELPEARTTVYMSSVLGDRQSDELFANLLHREEQIALTFAAACASRQSATAIILNSIAYMYMHCCV